MKKEDFLFPNGMEQIRKIILKGKVYESNGTLVMALETTCSLTKGNFKAVCVGLMEGWSKSEYIIIGSEMNCPIVNYTKDN